MKSTAWISAKMENSLPRLAAITAFAFMTQKRSRFAVFINSKMRQIPLTVYIGALDTNM